MASSRLSPPASTVAAGAPPGFFWCADAGPLPCADVHVGFRATLKLPAAATILIDHVAVNLNREIDSGFDTVSVNCSVLEIMRAILEVGPT